MFLVYLSVVKHVAENCDRSVRSLSQCCRSVGIFPKSVGKNELLWEKIFVFISGEISVGIFFCVVNLFYSNFYKISL